MKSLIISFRSELYKSRRSTIFFSSFLFPLILMSLIIFGLARNVENNAPPAFPFDKMGTGQWIQLIGNLGNLLSSLLVPFYTMFLAYSVNDVEHRADMWKSMFSLPLPKASIYIAKYLYAIFLLVLLFFCFYVFSVIGTKFLEWRFPNFYFYSHYDGGTILIRYLLKFFLSALGILAIQMMMGQLWKDFFKPIGIGFVGIIIGNIWAFKKPETAYLFPYSETIRAAFVERKKSLSGGNPLLDLQIFTPEIYMSLAYLLVFSILGYVILSKKNIK